MNNANTLSALKQALAERFGEEVAIPAGLEGLDQLLTMASQATHRAWAERAVDADLVRLLAACALSAPTKSYLQQADIVDLRDSTVRSAVESLVPSMPWMKAAPALLVFCGNGRRFRRIFERRDQAFTNEHLDGFFNPTVDATLVLMNFIRAASAIGMVCCPISVLRDRAEELATILDMPDHVFPVAGLCIGWPLQARSISPRLPLAATLHQDRFDEGHTDALIDAFDSRYVEVQSSRRPAGSTPAQTWSDERTKQYAASQRADWGRFVRKQKFDLS
ncbi:MAG: nitroreductase family protein [Burkholderiales bacterium]